MVGTAQPLCLSASETEGRRYEMTMNLGKSEITAPHYNAGLDDKIPSSRRGSVFLDIPFYRTGLSETDPLPKLCTRQVAIAEKRGQGSTIGG
jgi:hypothetical protein